MKKILSIILASVLLLSTVFISVPLSATATSTTAAAIQATPITDWTASGAAYEQVTATTVTPLGFTTAPGIKLTPTDTVYTSADYSHIKDSKAFAWAQMNNQFACGDATHYMFYIKLDAGNAFLPALEIDVGWGYNPALYLISKSYSYSAIGDSGWSEGTSDDTGAITFDYAFEGYIKFALFDLTGDVSYTSERMVAGLRVRLANSGGDYGGAVAGPFFLVTADSTSTEIEVPADYKSDPIKATPVTWNANAHSAGLSKSTAVYPVSDIVAKGFYVEAMSTPVQNDGNSRVYGAFDTAYTSTDMSQFILYVKTTKANSISPVIHTPSWCSLKASTIYEIAAIGDDSWTEKTTTSNGVEFDGAFEGYIKFDVATNFGASDIGGLLIYFTGGLGTGTLSDGVTEVDYGTVTVGPVLNITEDSISTEIEVPDDYKAKPIQATPLDWNAHSLYSGATSKTTSYYPLNNIVAEGFYVEPLSTPVQNDNAARVIGDLGGESYTSETLSTLLLYVEVEKANSIRPVLANSDGTSWKWLGAGKEYQVAGLDDTAWTVKTTTTDGYIEFAEAFKGYIKLDVAKDFGTTAFNSLFVYFTGGLGTGTLSDGVTEVDYGNVTVGPVFSVTKDNIMTEIEVPEEYRPAKQKLTAITNWTFPNYENMAGGYTSVLSESPLDFTTAAGGVLNRLTTEQFEAVNVSSDADYVRTYLEMNEGFDLTVAESIVMYVNIPAANTIVPRFAVNTGWSYNVSFTIGAGMTYYLAALGDETWTSYTASTTHATATEYYGGVVFDAAFEGFIKIPITSLTSGEGALSSKALALLAAIEVKFKGYCGTYGNKAAVGPYFIASNDTVRSEFELNAIIGDINKDSSADDTDTLRLRQYILGTEDAFVAANGDLVGDTGGNIDILDLVYMQSVADDIIFSKGSYYKTENSSVSGAIRTMSAYIYLPGNIKSTSRGGVIFGNYSGSGNCLNFEIAQNGNPRIYHIGTDASVDWQVSANVQTGDWVHLVFTVAEDGTAVCYINGEAVATKTGVTYDASVSNMSYILGGDNRTNNTNYFKGKIGEVALFSSALTADAVSEIYSNATAAGQADLVALYDVGTTKASFDIEDKTGNGNSLSAYTTFFYNEKADTDRAYSFAVVGDTQTMAVNYKDDFGKIYDWILENKDEKNIQYVFGLGDIVDNDTATAQWETAVNAINKMNGKIPYSVIRGNHDSVESMDKYFANDTYIGQFADGAEYYGFYDDGDDTTNEGEITNSYRTFTVGETDYLFLTLDYLHETDDGTSGNNPGQPLSSEAQAAILTWAKGVIDSFPEHKVIISTHYYVKANGDIASENYIEEDLVSQCPNVFMVLSGHIISDKVVVNATSYTTDGGEHTVTSLLVDPQGSDTSYNGLGMVAMLYFSADGKQIEVEYYSTVRDQYFLRDNQFVITVE